MESNPTILFQLAYYAVFLSVCVLNTIMLVYTQKWGQSQPSYHRDRVGELWGVSFLMAFYCIIKLTKTPETDVLELISEFGIGFSFNVVHYRILTIKNCGGCKR